MAFDIGKYWRNKGAITVPQCFSNSGLYAIGIAVLNLEENPGRITKKLKEHVKEYNMIDIDLDSFHNTYVDPKDSEKRRKLTRSAREILKFEKQNPEFKVMVLAAETDKKSYERMHDSKSPNIILMIFINPDGQCHWTAVRNFSRLSFDFRLTEHRGSMLHCFNCHRFSCHSKKKFEFHRELCENNLTQICTTPGPGQVIKFKNFKNLMKAPVIIYADFECYQRGTHTPSGLGMYVKSIDNSIYKSRYIFQKLLMVMFLKNFWNIF